MKIKVLGSEVLLVSEHSIEKYQDVEGYNPSALILKDEDGEEYFRVCFDETDSVSNYGIVFDNNRPSQKAVARLSFADDEEITAETIVKKYGKVISNLNDIEEKVKFAYEEMRSDIESWAEDIEFIEL